MGTVGSAFKYSAVSVSAVTVGKIQVQQDYRWGLLRERLQAGREAVDAGHFEIGAGFDQAQTDEVGVSGVVFD